MACVHADCLVSSAPDFLLYTHFVMLIMILCVQKRLILINLSFLPIIIGR